MGVSTFGVTLLDSSHDEGIVHFLVLLFDEILINIDASLKLGGYCHGQRVSWLRTRLCCVPD